MCEGVQCYHHGNQYELQYVSVHIGSCYNFCFVHPVVRYIALKPFKCWNNKTRSGMGDDMTNIYYTFLMRKQFVQLVTLKAFLIGLLLPSEVYNLFFKWQNGYTKYHHRMLSL